MTETASLEVPSLARRFAGDADERARFLRELHRKIAGSAPSIWIHRSPLDSVMAELDAANRRAAAGEPLPLLGVPFAVKDNIDVAGIPTTAACPGFAYTPTESAPVVDRLRTAGAILFGKTNLDQFATGLVGVRSPYGACENAFNREFIAGGSSSGSAVAVALGLVSFALGTDTAGSGRVPAALNNVVGLKPTRGRVSTRGVVPACRTLDSVSIFAGSCRDAALVFDVCDAYDPADPFSRAVPKRPPVWSKTHVRIGVPRRNQREFYDDAEAARIYEGAIERAAGLGAVREIDFEPFRLVAELLYGAPWVAERLDAAGDLLRRNPDAIHPVVRKILEGARSFDALSAFRAEYRLAELRRRSEAAWSDVDVLLLPTTPTTYRIADVEREPVELNRRLGHYTNFVNLLDFAAIAVPAGFRADGQPLGVTFVGRTFSDHELLALGLRFHARAVPAPTVGATGNPVPEPAQDIAVPRAGDFLLAVAGAHLAGQPLNHQLTSRGGSLVKACRTAPGYRFYALRGTEPPKPGLVYDANFRGEGIEVEVWSLDPAALGAFVDEVPPPLAIGTVTLDDGTTVNGFVCEPYALANATEITSYGGWRQYRAASSSAP